PSNGALPEPGRACRGGGGLRDFARGVRAICLGHGELTPAWLGGDGVPGYGSVRAGTGAQSADGLGASAPDRGGVRLATRGGRAIACAGREKPGGTPYPGRQ